jgi:hypothetical protein
MLGFRHAADSETAFAILSGLQLSYLFFFDVCSMPQLPLCPFFEALFGDSRL